MSIKFLKTWSKQNEKDQDEILEILDSSHFKTRRYDKLFDFTSISFQCSFGLKNQKIQNALKKQIDRNIISTPNFYTKQQNILSEKLIDLININGKIFYTTSGAESVSNAIKILRSATGKKLIYSVKKSYHGSTNEALEVTGDWRRENHQLPKNNHRWLPDPIDDPDFSQSFKILESNKQNLCGLIIEPTSGKNGVYTPSGRWWRGMNKAKKILGFKLIVDEVICGFYRTGKPFGFQNFKVTPDAVCMAKAISGGFVPFGAVFFRELSIKCFDKKVLSAGLTNYAHPLGVSAALSILKILNSAIFKKTFSSNLKIIKSFHHNMSNDFLIRSHGMLLAIELNRPLPKSIFFNLGLSVILNENMLILAPPLNCPPKLLSKNLNKIEKIIKKEMRPKNVFQKTG